MHPAPDRMVKHKNITIEIISWFIFPVFKIKYSD